MTPDEAARLLKATTKRRWPRWMWPSLAESKLRHQATTPPVTSAEHDIDDVLHP